MMQIYHNYESYRHQLWRRLVRPIWTWPAIQVKTTTFLLQYIIFNTSTQRFVDLNREDISRALRLAMRIAADSRSIPIAAEIWAFREPENQEGGRSRKREDAINSRFERSHFEITMTVTRIKEPIVSTTPSK